MAGVLPHARAAGIQVGWMSDASPSVYRERGYEWGNLCAARHFKSRSPEEYLDAGIELSIFHLDRDGADANAVWRDEDVERFLSLGPRLKCITTNHPKWLRKRLEML